MNERLRQSLAGGFTLVTASARLSRRLQYRHARDCIRRGLNAWETPDILHYEAWLERCWREQPAAAAPPRLLLSRAQSEHLWLEVIRASRQRGRLLHPAAVAREAARAWDTLQQWNSPPFPDDALLNEDARAFAGWMHAFRERCAAGGWIDPAALGAGVRSLLQGERGAERRIAFVGFESPTPAQAELAKLLQSGGGQVEHLSPEPRGRRAPAHGFDDRRAEVRAAAHWIRARLESDAAVSIGVVMPDLAARRRLIEEIFDDVLRPAGLLDAPPAGNRAYSIAVGMPLAEYPIVAAALGGLALGRRALPLVAAGSLLRSPFLMRTAGEAAELACLDALLRRRGDAQFDLAALLQAAETHGRERGAEPAIAERLRQARGVLEALPRTQSLHGWAGSFSKLLMALGWPGGRALDSGEYQAAEAWRGALGEFAALDLFGNAPGFDAALAELSRTLAAVSFQPRTGEAPVEVLGMDGAADMGFDSVWVMGLDEGTWPPPARPTPFIPMRMQRELRMPLASPELSLRHARGITQRLADCAIDVVFSHPRLEAETPLRPSPLLAAPTDDAEPPRFAPGIDYTGQLFAPRRLEVFADDRATPIPPDWHTAGGAALFRDQAACPFRGFARHRLGARALDPIDIGLDAQSRGSLVHRVLESIWTRLRDQRALLELDGAGLERLIVDVAGQAVASLQRNRPGTVTPRFAEVEKLRLETLLRGWLALERGRAPFTVEACESAREIELDGLRLRLRIDRIDRLADGRRVILDYKTGEARTGDWAGDRPNEPQLPLYAVTDAEPVAALAFAQLRPGAHAFIGTGESAELLPGIKAVAALRLSGDIGTWEALLRDWRRSLEALAAEFRAGEARVDPKGPQACQYCDLQALCRIDESQPWFGAADD